MGSQSSRPTKEPPTTENERPSTAGNDQPFDVFLSHAGYGAQKTGIVTLIYNELRRRDVKTFFDRDSLFSLREGELAPPKMVWAAATAKVVVVVLSPEYISRVWTLKEVEIALARCGGASSRRESARRFRGEELSFKDFLVKRFSEVELDLVREMEFETDGFPGDVFPLFFTLLNGECGHIQSTLDKYPEVGRCFGQWSVADDSNKQSYPGRWKTVLSHLKDITGPEFQIHSDDEPSYAKRVAKLIRDRYFRGRRLQIRQDDPRKRDTIVERVREEIPSFLELPEIWRGVYPPLQRSQCDILQFCVQRELGGDIEVVGNMNVRDIVMPGDPDWEQLQGIIQSETRFTPVWLSSSAADMFIGLQELVQGVNERLESGRRSGMVDLLAHREKLSQIKGTAFVRHVEPLIRKHEDAIVAALQATLCIERLPAHVYLIAGVVFADLRATAEVRRSSVVNDDAIESGRNVPDYILSKDCAVAIQLMRFKLGSGSEHPDGQRREVGVRSTDHERSESEQEDSSRITERSSDGGTSPDSVSSGGRHQSGRTVHPWRIGDLIPLDETDEVTCIRPMMSNGPKGLHSDPVYAFELHRRAARLGFAPSIDKLGVCYRDGIGTEKDYRLAVELFQKAADRGQADSLYNLGVCFEQGKGAEQDFARALDVFQRAVGLGHLDAAYRLALFKLYGLAQNQDISGAYEALKSLAHQNHVASLRECAYLNMCPFIAPHGASIVDTRGLLFRAIQLERGDISLYMLAHILASTLDIEYIREARELVSRIANESRKKVLMNFIEDQLSDQEYWNWNVTPESDFISGAELQLVARIGCGQFAQLFLARFRRTKWAAVKCIAVDCDEFVLRDSFRERFTCQVLRAVELPGATRYLGCVDFGCGQSGLVFELCADISNVESEAISIVEENRVAASARFTDFRLLPDWSSRVRSNLRQSVVFSPRQRWPTKRIIGMLQRVATALMKLHEVGFVHRDIADRNVLCDVDGQVQLADFGLAKFVGSRAGGHYEDVYTFYKTYLTPGHQYALSWWAPECVQNSIDGWEAHFSAKSDAYSFGILMWQCFSHRDPFDEARSFESPEKAASAIVARILSGERPSFEYLDSGVPAGLLDLMSSSWETDPDKRPSMGEVQVALAEIEASISTEPARQVVRNSRKLKEKWFDVRATYHELPLPPQRVENSTVASAAAFSRVHSESIPDARVPAKGSGDVQHYDVFLVHSGEQKMVEAATMKAIMSSGCLECFLDAETFFVPGPTIKEIQSALETCRHAVAVVSRSFLSRRVPWNELLYSCERDRWVRKRYQKWETLWIVLYDLSVSEFQEACASSGGPVPNISSNDVRLIEWSRQNTWVELCLKVKNEILRQDESATEQWADFLDNWKQSKTAEDFPRADWVYK